jgi:nucleoside-diphosphate-sugar epimerase
MRIVVIGATGHVGGYLIPRLVLAGHEVIAISRGQQPPYRDHPSWSAVQRVVADRQAEDATGVFAGRVADLHPDVVIDMICFTRESAEQLVGALTGRVELLIHCGSIWVHGPSAEVPTVEDSPRHPFGEYGIGKAEIEDVLVHASRRGGLPSIVLHPGHISGPGWPVINPACNTNPNVWHRLATGQEVLLPNLGLETLHHVHADDVAQAFELAARRPAQAIGQRFHITSERAITLQGYAKAVAGWFGQQANLRYVPLPEFRAATTAEHADLTWGHIARSASMSVDKARQLLGYRPRYTSLQAVAEALHWLQRNHQVDVGHDDFAYLPEQSNSEA